MTIPKNTNCKTQHRADWHCHILPNLDDGAKNMTESLAIATILAEAGFSEVHCTPHAMSGAYEASPNLIRQATLELQEAPAAAQYEPVFTVLCYLLSPDFRNVAKGLESCAEVRALALRLRLREVCRQLARWAKRMFLGHVRQCVVNSPAPQKGGPKCRLLK